MIRLPARPAAALLAAAAAVLPAPGALLTAQETFTLPPGTPTTSPTPAPAPAGPADERAGVAIPPRAEPSAVPSAAPQPSPSASRQAPVASSAPRRASTPAPTPQPSASAAAASITLPPPVPGQFDDGVSDDPQFVPRGQQTQPDAAVPASPLTLPEISPPALSLPPLPRWWPWAAGGLGVAALLILGALLWRRRKPKVLRLAPPPPGLDSDASVPALPRLDLALDITGATRSVMMFTLQYRLTIANRTARAANDLSLAVQLASAQRGTSNAASPGAAHALAQVERIGPHQSRTVTGSVQLPLAAIAVLQQGSRPLFIPLVHVTLDAAGTSALARSFVIGTPSASGGGRLHPILLEGPPGGIAGLVAQPIAIPSDSAAA